MAQWLSSLDKDVTVALIGLIGAIVGGLVVGVLNIVSAHWSVRTRYSLPRYNSNRRKIRVRTQTPNHGLATVTEV